MSARAITENLIQKETRFNPNRLSTLKMYGEEINIIKSPRKGEYMSLSKDVIIKALWHM